MSAQTMKPAAVIIGDSDGKSKEKTVTLTKSALKKGEKKCVELWHPGFDARFPQTNQTRRCWQNYVDFFRCQNRFGEKDARCDYFRKTYIYICPSFWISLPLVSRHKRGEAMLRMRRGKAGSMAVPRSLYCEPVNIRGHLLYRKEETKVKVNSATIQLMKKDSAKRGEKKNREIWHPGFDARFPQTNQTRRCWQNYVDFFRCQSRFGKNESRCEIYRKTYLHLCPGFWIERFDDMRESGTFPASLE